MNKIFNKTVLVVVAHPDDETIGCGGLIAKLKKNKNKVYALYLADGRTARGKIKVKKNKTSEELKNASKILGFKWISNLCGKFLDQKLDSYPLLSLIKIVEEAKRKVKPNIVITHSKSDLNRDHRLVFETVLTAFRPKHKERWNTILSFEIPSATDYGNNAFKQNFNPTYFVNIKQEWKKKEKALRSYKTEMLKFPNSRSIKGIKALNQIRGVQNGMEIAEAFELIKYISR